MEIVLGDGRLVVAARDSIQYGDLFACVIGGLGTMGIVTAVAIRLVPAARFVRTEYFHFDSAQQYSTALKMVVQRGASQPDFVEGFQFSTDSAVLCVSSFVNTLPQPAAERTREAKCTYTAPTATTKQALGTACGVHSDTAASGSLPAGTMISSLGDTEACHRCDHFWNPLEQDKAYTYQHALQCALDGAAGKPWAKEVSLFRHLVPGGANAEAPPRPGVDYMTTASYIARHQRGALWTMAALASKHVLSAGVCSTSEQADNLEQSALSPLGMLAKPGGLSSDAFHRSFVQQDTVWRMDGMEKATKWVQQYMGVWPLWHRPRFMPASNPVSTPHTLFSGAHVFTNAGYAVHIVIIGEPCAAAFVGDPCGTLRQLQLRCHLPALSSRAFLSPDELQRRIDIDTYQQLRSEFGADGAFPEVGPCLLAPVSEEVGGGHGHGKGKPCAWRLKRSGMYLPVLAISASLCAAAFGLLAGRLLRQPPLTGKQGGNTDPPPLSAGLGKRQ